MIEINQLFYRIVFKHFSHTLLNGVIHPEGRFHHNGEPAIYMSPTPQAASIAIDRYVEQGDNTPRVICELMVKNALVCDVRDPNTCSKLDIDPTWASTLWSDERANGIAATTWKVSDAVRATGADGMIYASRRAPSRWHLVLFQWNNTRTKTTVTLCGSPKQWDKTTSAIDQT